MTTNGPPADDRPDGFDPRHGRRNPHGKRRFGMEFNVYGPGGHPLQSRLYRNPRDGWARGVCAGLGDYFGISPAWFRFGFFFGFVFFFFPAVVIYFLAGWLLPVRPDHLYGDPQEEAFWRGVRTAPDRTFSGLAHRFRGIERRLRRMEAVVTSREFRLGREIDGL